MKTPTALVIQFDSKEELRKFIRAIGLYGGLGKSPVAVEMDDQDIEDVGARPMEIVYRLEVEEEGGEDLEVIR